MLGCADAGDLGHHWRRISRAGLRLPRLCPLSKVRNLNRLEGWPGRRPGMSSRWLQAVRRTDLVRRSVGSEATSSYSTCMRPGRLQGERNKYSVAKHGNCFENMDRCER